MYVSILCVALELSNLKAKFLFTLAQITLTCNIAMRPLWYLLRFHGCGAWCKPRVVRSVSASTAFIFDVSFLQPLIFVTSESDRDRDFLKASLFESK